MCEMTREISCKAERYSDVVFEVSLGATGELTVSRGRKEGIEKSSAARIHISIPLIQEPTNWIYLLLCASCPLLAVCGVCRQQPAPPPASARPALRIQMSLAHTHAYVRNFGAARRAWWGDKQHGKCNIGSAAAAGVRGRAEVVSHV